MGTNTNPRDKKSCEENGNQDDSKEDIGESLKEELSYELVELPSIKSIKQLKYTYENEIVFLANDQILYGIVEDN